MMQESYKTIKYIIIIKPCPNENPFRFSGNSLSHYFLGKKRVRIVMTTGTVLILTLTQNNRSLSDTFSHYDDDGQLQVIIDKLRLIKQKRQGGTMFTSNMSFCFSQLALMTSQNH